MEKRSPISRLPKWTTLFALGAVALVVIVPLYFSYSIAQEKPADQAQRSTEAKPATDKPAAAEETAKPADAGKTDEKSEAAEKKESEETEELTNESCIECHNPDIRDLSKEDLADQVEVGDKPQPKKPKPLFIFGELNLSIDEKKYAEGVHADTTCVDCHVDVKELPHAQRLKPVNCVECHEESVVAVEASAHGKKAGPKAIGCIGCHDVHYGKGKDVYAKQWKEALCVKCHMKYGLDTVAAHKHLYEAKMHMALGCLICHQGEEPGVHNIPLAKTKVASCESCHNKKTILSEEKPKDVSFLAYIQQTGFINSDALKKYGYVVGAHRIPALDAIIILVFLGTFALPIIHGGLRILTRRKEPFELPEEKILLHPLTERLWHWVQALCIVMLVITGIMIHWPESFPTWFDWAISVHNWFGIAAVIMWIIWFVYNLGTRRISHYLPRKGEIPKGVIVQAKFYGYGIFKHEPHPYAPSEDNKFNPLQKIAYLKFQMILLPVLLLSGVIYMYPETFRGFIDAIGGMTVLATIHYILGALFAAFLVAHLYLGTTGETVGENYKAIITGYGIKEEHGDHQ